MNVDVAEYCGSRYLLHANSVLESGRKLISQLLVS